MNDLLPKYAALLQAHKQYNAAIVISRMRVFIRQDMLHNQEAILNALDQLATLLELTHHALEHRDCLARMAQLVPNAEVKTALQARVTACNQKLARPIDHQRHYFSALLPPLYPRYYIVNLQAKIKSLPETCWQMLPADHRGDGGGHWLHIDPAVLQKPLRSA